MTVMDMKPAANLLGWNSKYLSSFQGILNVCQIVLGFASLELLKDTCRPAYSSSTGGFVGSSQETYFYLLTFSCIVMTTIVLFSFTISHISCSLMERTVLCVMFWSISCLMCFATSFALLLYVTAPNSMEVFGYSHKVATALLGFINSGLYLISAVKSYKTCRSNWTYQ